MPRLLNLRALCAHCEKAEAKSWSVPNRTPLCKACANDSTAVPIVSSTVVTALCSQCGIAPASLLEIGQGVPLCEICASGCKGEVVPLRDSDAVGGIVFDKMDFSGLQGKSVISDSVQGERVDLSYYKTKVPQSLVVKQRKRAPEESLSSTLKKSR